MHACIRILLYLKTFAIGSSSIFLYERVPNWVLYACVYCKDSCKFPRGKRAILPWHHHLVVVFTKPEVCPEQGLKDKQFLESTSGSKDSFGSDGYCNIYDTN